MLNEGEKVHSYFAANYDLKESLFSSEKIPLSFKLKSFKRRRRRRWDQKSIKLIDLKISVN